MHKILCFDTSNNSCSVSITDGAEILAFEQELKPSMQAERIMIMIESALKYAKLNYKDLNYIVTIIGPGSFTGIRISLAIAQGIMHSTGINGVGVTSFEAAHYRLCGQVKKFDYAFIFINAYRGQQYVQVFDSNGPVSDASLLNNDEIRALIQSYQGVLACAGSGLSSIYEQIKNIDNLIILPRFPIIKAIHIANFAKKKILMNQINNIEPLYIRPPDALPAKIKKV